MSEVLVRKVDAPAKPMEFGAMQTKKLERKAISTRTRFEIFKRDGFRCHYCGSTPQEKVLRVDHRVPVSGGGTNDDFNLVTSCFDCNAGKSDVPLDELKFRTEQTTEAQREHAEQIREWTKYQRAIAEAKNDVIDSALVEWSERCRTGPGRLAAHLRGAIKKHDLARVLDAIRITGENLGDEYGSDQLRYFYGVLKRAADPKAYEERKRLEAEQRTRESAPPAQSTRNYGPRYGRIFGEIAATFEQFRRQPDQWPSSIAKADELERVFLIASGMSADIVEHYFTENWSDPLEYRGIRLTVTEGGDVGVRANLAKLDDYNPFEEAYNKLAHEIFTSIEYLVSYYDHCQENDRANSPTLESALNQARYLLDAAKEIRDWLSPYQKEEAGKDIKHPSWSGD